MQMTIIYHFNGSPDFMIPSFLTRLVLNVYDVTSIIMSQIGNQADSMEI